ncbi:MAG: hypothetical protein ABI222_06195 [Opitutaceae bacterium]
MRRQLSLVLTLTAWLIATGGQWELVQALGWGRMIVSYSQSMSVEQAVQKTFAGDELCSMCRIVQHAQQNEDANGAKIPGLKAPEKIFFVGSPSVLVFASPAPQCAGRVAGPTALVSAELSAPLGPPPRLQA